MQSAHLRKPTKVNTASNQKDEAPAHAPFGHAIPNSALLSLLQYQSEDASSEQPNKTGLPDAMKAHFEQMAGLPLDDVRVHRNSDKPAELGAEAYAQGNEIHLGPGQEKHLEHELGHVVQQKAGLIKPTNKVNGLDINDESVLEMNAEKSFDYLISESIASAPVIQMQFEVDRPDTWKRPPWDKDMKSRLWKKQIALREIDVKYPDTLTKEEKVVKQTICPICHEPLSFQGSAIDHITDWKRYILFQKPSNYSDFVKAYNDEENLVLVHSSCNSSKNAKSFEEFAALGLQSNRKTVQGSARKSKKRARSIQRIFDYIEDTELDYDTKMMFTIALRAMLVEYNITGNDDDLALQIELLSEGITEDPPENSRQNNRIIKKRKAQPRNSSRTRKRRKKEEE